MPKPERIKPGLRKLIEPHLVQHLDEEKLDRIDEMFENVVYTYPDGYPLVTLDPLDYAPAMQFSAITGEFMGITPWDYIQEVDVDKQLEEAMK